MLPICISRTARGRWIFAGRRSVIALAIAAGLLLALVPAKATEGEGRREPRLTLADVGKLDCGQLEQQARLLQREFGHIWAIQKKAQERRFADLEQIEKIRGELSIDTFEAAKQVFEKVKQAKEVGEAGHSVTEIAELSEELTEAEAAIGSAERIAEASASVEAAAKASRAMRALAGAGLIATNPYLVLAIFAIDAGLQAYEAVSGAIARGREANLWNDESFRLTQKLVHQQDGISNLIAQVSVQREEKQCPIAPGTSAGACYGKACGTGAIAKADVGRDSNSWWNIPSMGLGYWHVCDMLNPNPSPHIFSFDDYKDNFDFDVNVRGLCHDEYENLTSSLAHRDDPDGYRPFALTSQVVEKHADSIREHCEQQVCKICADGSKDPQAANRHCEATFGAEAQRKDRAWRGVGLRPYQGPPVDYGEKGHSPHTDEEMRQLEKDYQTQRTVKRWAAEAEGERRARRAGAAEPASLPGNQRRICQCFAHCINPQSSYSLGNLASLYSDDADAVKFCTLGVQNYDLAAETSQRYCPGGEHPGNPVACEVQTFDSLHPPTRAERIAGSQKCEWRDQPRDTPKQLGEGSVMEIGSYSGAQIPGPVLLHAVKVLAACNVQGFHVTLCMRLSNVAAFHGGRNLGYESECWNSEGRTEIRGLAYDYRTYSPPYERLPPNRQNPLPAIAGTGTVVGAAVRH
jgi:hypothetical protein